jgi:hypothetical protein
MDRALFAFVSELFLYFEKNKDELPVFLNTTAFRDLIHTHLTPEHLLVIESIYRALPNDRQTMDRVFCCGSRNFEERLRALEAEQANTRTIEGSFVTLLQEQRTYFEHELAKMRVNSKY